MFKKAVSVTLCLLLTAAPFAGLNSVAADLPAVVYELFDTDNAELTDGAEFEDQGSGTAYLNNAGSDFKIYRGAPSYIEVTKKDATQKWQGLDIRPKAFVSNAEYMIEISGRAPGGSVMYLINDNSTNEGGLRATVAGSAESLFGFTLTATDYEYVSNPIRINGTLPTGKGTFYIDSIKVTMTKEAEKLGDIEEIDDILISFAPATVTWNNKFQPNGNGVTIDIDGAYSRNDDGYALKVERTANALSDYNHWVRLGHVTEWGAGQELKLPKGCTYTIKAWFYVPVAAADGKASITGPQIFLNNNNNGASISPSDAGTITPGVWKEIVFETPLMPSTLDSITFRIGTNSEATYPAVWYIDDISIVQNIVEPPDIPDPDYDTFDDTLKNLYKDYFLIGNIISDTNYSELIKTPASTADSFLMLKHHFNVMTAENLNKPSNVAPHTGGTDAANEPDTYTGLSRVKDMINWCNTPANEMEGYVAHTLVWHSQSACWMAGCYKENHKHPILTRAEAKANMKKYIDSVAKDSAIAGEVISWDVVNEAFSPGVGGYNASSGWRSYLRTASNSYAGTGHTDNNASPWYAAYANGEGDPSDYIYDAFVFARLADPSKTKLYYNDYNDEERGKSTAISAMVRELNYRWMYDDNNTDKAKAPAGSYNAASYVDTASYNEDGFVGDTIYAALKAYTDNGGRLLIEGIGLQAHYHTELNTKSVEAAIKRYIKASPGIELSVTELDITITGTAGKDLGIDGPKPDEHMLNLQANLYAELFEIYMKYAAGTANAAHPERQFIKRVTFWGTDDESSWRAYGGSGAKQDGGYPTLFDKNYAAKPAFHAVYKTATNDYTPHTFPPPPPPPAPPAGTLKAAAMRGSPELGTDDPLWYQSPKLTVNKNVKGTPAAAGNATGEAYVMWDDEYLYVRVEVTDADINTDSGNDYEKDSVEVFVSEIGHRGSYGTLQGGQYRVALHDGGARAEPSGNWAGESWNGPYRAALTGTTGYVAEFMIPLALANVQDRIICFDIQINDATEAIHNDNRAQITWNDPAANGYNSSKNWGSIVLVDSDYTYKVEYYKDSMSKKVSTVYGFNSPVGGRLTPADVTIGLGDKWIDSCKYPGYGVALVSYPTISADEGRNVVKVLYMAVNS